MGFHYALLFPILDRIIRLSSNEKDLVLDPFCGSGTTLLSASLNNRRFWGIDINEDAIFLTQSRLKNGIKSKSKLLERGRSSYDQVDNRLEIVLSDIEYQAIQRNAGIDAILSQKKRNYFIFVRLQKPFETVSKGVQRLKRAMSKKGKCFGIFIIFEKEKLLFSKGYEYHNIFTINSHAIKIQHLIDSLSKKGDPK